MCHIKVQDQVESEVKELEVVVKEQEDLAVEQEDHAKEHEVQEPVTANPVAAPRDRRPAQLSSGERGEEAMTWVNTGKTRKAMPRSPNLILV